MSKFNVVSKYVAAVPRSQRRKGAGVSSAPSSGVAGSGIDKNTLSQFVDLYSPQTVEGLKNYLNGLQIGGKLVKYDAVTNAFVFPGNILAEGGVAWNTKLEGFEKQTITAAVQVDWDTIGKNENGELYVIGGTSGGGGGVVGGVTLDEVKNYLTAEKYTTETWVSSQNYATQSWVTNKGYITGITGSMVTSALGYTPLDSANFTKAKVKSTLGISDWALASVKPSYKFSEITNKPTTLAGYGITDTYTKNEVSNAITEAFNAFASNVSNDGVVNTYKELIDYAATHGADFTTLVGVVNGKADKATTLAGYGIVDAYTKTQVDSYLDKKWTQNDQLISNWSTAFDWGNHALAGYAKQSDVTSELGEYVTLATAQTITGVKNFVNGAKIGGLLLSYNSTKNAFVIPANVVIEGGVAWNSKLDGFDIPTIMDAVIVDGDTIVKENGVLKVNGDVSGGIDETQLGDYLTRNNYAKKSDIPSLSGYATESFVTTRGYITASAIPTKVSAFTNDASYATESFVTSRGYITSAAISKANIKSILGISDWALAATSPLVNHGKITSTTDLTALTTGVGYTQGYTPVEGAYNYGQIINFNGTRSHTQLYVADGGATYLRNDWNKTGLADRAWREILSSSTYTKYALSLTTDQDVTGIKNFVNGFKVGGKLVSYNSAKNAFVLPANLIVEGGIAWYSKLDGFDVPTITNAVKIDNATIKKNSDSGALEVSADVIVRIATLEARIEQLHPTAQV